MTLRMKLDKLLKESDNALERYVLEDLIEEEVDDNTYGAKGYLNDLLSHGCVSGMVGELIYYHDTLKFYSKYANEIDELREELESEIGEPLKIGTPSYNWLAWFGYEEMARKIANELELDL